MVEALSNLISVMARNFQAGGLFMYPIAFVGIFSLAICVERAYALFMKFYVDGDALMAAIRKYLDKNDRGQAMKVCGFYQNAAVARVLKAALSAADRGQAALQSAIDEATLNILPQIQKRTIYLPMIANVVTLLGLLGTITGLIEAFSGLAQVDPIARQDALSQGISVALNATAFALLIAIPSMAVYSILTARTLTIVDDIDRCSITLVNQLIQTPPPAPEKGEGKKS